MKVGSSVNTGMLRLVLTRDRQKLGYLSKWRLKDQFSLRMSIILDQHFKFNQSKVLIIFYATFKVFSDIQAQNKVNSTRTRNIKNIKIFLRQP